MNLVFQKGVDLTAITVDQLREFLITLFHAPKSSLENPSWARMSGPRSLIAIAQGELNEYEGHWAQDENASEVGFLDGHEDILWLCDEAQYWIRQPFQGRFLKKGGGNSGKSKGKGKKGISMAQLLQTPQERKWQGQKAGES